MVRRLKVTALVLLFAFIALGSTDAQTTNSQSRVLGEVLKIDPNTKQLILKTTEGAQITLECDDKTVYRRVPPGEKTLDNATLINLTDISVGDRVIARGSTTTGSNALSARGVIVIDREEIAQKKQRDRAEWASRGIEGVVTALKPETNEITLLSHSVEGPKSFTVATTGSHVLRYAPDSIRYSDAKPSSIAEMKVGDRLRALVNKDGTRLVAEEIVFGFYSDGGRVRYRNRRRSRRNKDQRYTKQAAAHDYRQQRFDVASPIAGSVETLEHRSERNSTAEDRAATPADDC